MLCSLFLPVSSSHSSPEGLAGVPVPAFLRSVRRKGLSPTHYRHWCIVCLAMADLNSPRTFQDTYVTMSLDRNPCLGLPPTRGAAGTRGLLPCGFEVQTAATKALVGSTFLQLRCGVSKS